MLSIIFQSVPSNKFKSLLVSIFIDGMRFRSGCEVADTVVVVVSSLAWGGPWSHTCTISSFSIVVSRVLSVPAADNLVDGYGVASNMFFDLFHLLG